MTIGDEAGHVRQADELVLADGGVTQLQLQIGDHGTEIGVAAALAVYLGAGGFDLGREPARQKVHAVSPDADGPHKPGSRPRRAIGLRRRARRHIAPSIVLLQATAAAGNEIGFLHYASLHFFRFSSTPAVMRVPELSVAPPDV